jgi:zinc protease
MPAQAFDIVKRQTAQFVAGNLKSPEYRTARALDTALLPARDPLLREATPESVANVTLEAVQQYRSATLRPDLTTIVVIGDVSASEARSVVEKWFGGWRSEGPAPNTTLPQVPANKPTAVAVDDPEAVQDSVFLAEQLESSRFDPDYYPLELGTQVLGGGFYASRLYHDLRQTAGYVYTVDVRLDASKTRADYEVTYGCDPQNVSKARALIERDLEQMRSQAVPEEELYRAKALLLRKLVLQESSEEAVARGLLARAELDLPLDEPIIAARKYRDLSAAEIEAAFSRLIRSTDLVQVVRGPPPH